MSSLDLGANDRHSLARAQFCFLRLIPTLASLCAWTFRYYFGAVEKKLEKEIKAEEDRRRVGAAAGKGVVDEQASPDDEDDDDGGDLGFGNILKRAIEAKQRGSLVVGGRGSESVDHPSSKRRRIDSSVNDRIMKEWELYRKEKSVGCNRVKKLGGPLKWWATKAIAYPTVAKIARKYLAVQASSAASERLFSVDGNTVAVAEKRNRVSGERAADIIFLHENMEHKRWQ